MIKVGDSLPAVEVQLMENGKVISRDVRDIFAGKRVVMVGVPGAFTPTCSEKHLPGYLNALYDFKKAGIDLIACVSVNDAFVMTAWAKSLDITNEIVMLADGSAKLTKALGLELDLSDSGLGLRCVRFAMAMDNNEVTLLNVENGGAFQVSKAEVVLADLERL